MLTTGVRTPVGIKVFGEDLTEIERISVALEGMLRQVPGTRSTFAERQTGREYVDIVPNREAIARYGLTVRDVQDVVEAAVGGMTVSTAIAGRARFSINLRYAADQRADPQALRRILVPVPVDGQRDGLRAAAMREPAPARQAAAWPASGGGGTGRRHGRRWAAVRAQPGVGVGRHVGEPPAPPMGGVSASPDFMEQWRQPGAAVPLGATRRRPRDHRSADDQGRERRARRLRVRRHRPDPARPRRLGGRCQGGRGVAAHAARRAIGCSGPASTSSSRRWKRGCATSSRSPWSSSSRCSTSRCADGRRPSWCCPACPLRVAGSVWLLAFMDYNLSTAVWVGLIAVAGVAAETGIVMVVYLDEAFARYMQEGRIQKPDDVDAAVVDGAAARVRPLVMTVATTVLGLLPLLWEAGVGADVSARTAAPVVGGLWSCMLLTLLVLPAAYAMWRREQVRRAIAAASARASARQSGAAVNVEPPKS